ncbi:hypothetical protein APT03_19920 [Escherichia coli]|nr:hypothetical protein APT03_19920 [Escherichia coli]
MNGEIISLNNCSVFRARHNNQPVGQCLRSFEGKMKIFPGLRCQTRVALTIRRRQAICSTAGIVTR